MTLKEITSRKIVATFLTTLLFMSVIVIVFSTDIANAESDIQVLMKAKKKITLISIKNDGDTPIYYVEFKASDGNIRYIKAKDWDRLKIEANYVMIMTDNKPLTKGRNMVVLLMIDNPSSELEWSAFGEGHVLLSYGEAKSGKVESIAQPTEPKQLKEPSKPADIFEFTGTSTCLSKDNLDSPGHCWTDTTNRFHLTVGNYKFSWQVTATDSEASFYATLAWDMPSGGIMTCGNCSNKGSFTGSKIWEISSAGEYILYIRAPYVDEWKAAIERIDSTIKKDTVSNLSCTGIATCFTATVTNVVDGDTLDVNTVRIRLALTNTPERGESNYKEATQFTATLCPVGSAVLVDEDDGQTEGSYDRMIAKVFCGSKVLNAELLYAGLAVIDTRFCNESEFGKEDWAQRYGCES